MSDSKGFGCGPMVVVAIFAFVMGGAIGAGGVWFYLERVVDKPEPTAIEVQALPPKATADDDRYAVFYPLEQTLRVDGPLPEKEVREMVLAKRFELRKCYQDALETNPALKGDMSLQFTVAGSNGKVTAAVERHTNFSEKKVTNCILDHIRKWQFSGERKSQSVVKFDVMLVSMTAAEAAP